jgi:hypothetical protein
MHDFFSKEPDPLEGMLSPSSQPSENEALRRKVYTQTQRVLRRRRHLRKFAYALSLLAAFTVGAGVMRITAHTDSGEQKNEGPPMAQKNPEADAPRSPDSNDSALDVEWTAFESTDHRAELYRRAGDRYMEEQSDPLSALRSYGNALDNGTEKDLAISTDDNWLFMAIKDARLKEKKYAKQGG